MAENQLNYNSEYYKNVIKELSLIVNTEKITDYINPVLALEVKLYYINKNNEQSEKEQDKIIKKMIQEKTQALEVIIQDIIKEYDELYQRLYLKESDVNYLYIKVSKQVKYNAHKRYGDKLHYTKKFYIRYSEWRIWTENLKQIRSQAIQKLKVEQ